MVDDLLVLKDITKRFVKLYDMFLEVDALRIMPGRYANHTIKHTDISLNGEPVSMLSQDSAYQISFSPNIWKRPFLMDCLKTRGSPWHSELHGSKRMKNKGYTQLQYIIEDWYYPAIRQGTMQDRGRELIKAINHDNKGKA